VSLALLRLPIFNRLDGAYARSRQRLEQLYNALSKNQRHAYGAGLGAAVIALAGTVRLAAIPRLRTEQRETDSL
jgi:hypothetical protein